MENKINIVEILKDCPSGMELDCTLFEGLEFDGIVDNEYLPIRCRIKNPNGGYNVYNFTKYGCWLDTTFAKCVIFPKGKTTWEGLQRPFNNGDIIKTITNNEYLFYSIYKGIEDKNVLTYINYVPDKNKIISIGGVLCLTDEITEQRFATEEEKQKLFDAIKANGYKWNEKTKTLDKLITPKKFDINTLKPFKSRVLVRDRDNDEWRGHFFSHYDNGSDKPYICIGQEGLSEYKFCIPYEGNEHLLGTTNDCDEFYKNW